MNKNIAKCETDLINAARSLFRPVSQSELESGDGPSYDQLKSWLLASALNYAIEHLQDMECEDPTFDQALDHLFTLLGSV